MLIAKDDIKIALRLNQTVGFLLPYVTNLTLNGPFIFAYSEAKLLPRYSSKLQLISERSYGDPLLLVCDFIVFPLNDYFFLHYSN